MSARPMVWGKASSSVRSSRISLLVWDYFQGAEPFEEGVVVQLGSNQPYVNGEIFNSLKQAQIVIEQWRKHYNTRSRHSALCCRPPAPVIMLCTLIQPSVRFHTVSEVAIPAVNGVDDYVAFLRLATPTSPNRPEPNNQTAAGTGTTASAAP